MVCLLGLAWTGEGPRAHGPQGLGRSLELKVCEHTDTVDLGAAVAAEALRLGCGPKEMDSSRDTTSREQPECRGRGLASVLSGPMR